MRLQWLDRDFASYKKHNLAPPGKRITQHEERECLFLFQFSFVNLIYILDRKLFFHQIVVILTFLWLLWWQNMYLPVSGSLHSCNSLDFLATHLQGWKVIILYFLVQAFICDQAPFYTYLKITVNFDFKHWNLT
jgi:hypothetical protein